ncbi:MAG: TetR/AcrR family transcriptional regulator [Acidobacteriota bacterium]
MTTETLTETAPTVATPKKGGRRKASLFDDERAGRIYRTAAKMIYEKGFAATSMNEIAEAVELTKPGLYYYVKGKKELLFAIMCFAMDLLDVEVVARAEEARDPEARLRVIVSRHAHLFTQDVSAMAILIDEVGGLSEAQRVAITARKRAYFDFIRQTLEALQADGRMRPIDTTTATFSILGIVMWLSRWYQSDGRMASDTVVADVTEIALNGVLTGTGAIPGGAGFGP